MNRSKFSESQIIGILKQAEAGMPARELCRQNGIFETTFYKWRSKYGGYNWLFWKIWTKDKAGCHHYGLARRNVKNKDEYAYCFCYAPENTSTKKETGLVDEQRSDRPCKNP